MAEVRAQAAPPPPRPPRAPPRPKAGRCAAARPGRPPPQPAAAAGRGLPRGPPAASPAPGRPGRRRGRRPRPHPRGPTACATCSSGGAVVRPPRPGRPWPPQRWQPPAPWSPPPAVAAPAYVALGDGITFGETDLSYVQRSGDRGYVSRRRGCRPSPRPNSAACSPEPAVGTESPFDLLHLLRPALLRLGLGPRGRLREQHRHLDGAGVVGVVQAEHGRDQGAPAAASGERAVVAQHAGPVVGRSNGRAVSRRPTRRRGFSEKPKPGDEGITGSKGSGAGASRDSTCRQHKRCGTRSRSAEPGRRPTRRARRSRSRSGGRCDARPRAPLALVPRRVGASSRRAQA